MNDNELNYGNLIGIIRTFSSAEEMLSAIQDDEDFYNVTTGVYVFNYNEVGSVCYYTLSMKEAETLQTNSLLVNNHGDLYVEEYWGGQLGWGGLIYDDISYKGRNPNHRTNLDFCKDCFATPGWIRVDPKAVTHVLAYTDIVPGDDLWKLREALRKEMLEKREEER